MLGLKWEITKIKHDLLSVESTVETDFCPAPAWDKPYVNLW